MERAATTTSTKPGGTSPPQAGASVDIQHVSVSYLIEGRFNHALEDVSALVRPSEFVCLVGRSGCGKSTLLNVIANIVPATRGEVLIDGCPVAQGGCDVGVVFQEYALYPWRTAAGNVAFALEMKKTPKEQRRELVQRYLHLVELDRHANLFPHQLSGGMKQRVAIARALAYDANVLLMDEPFGALDAFTRERLQELVVDLWLQTRKTIVYVTHNIAEAVYLADRIIVLAGQPGRIRQEVAVDLPRPRDPLSVPFIECQRDVTTLVKA